MSGYALRDGVAADWPALTALLRAAELPVDDLRESSMGSFICALRGPDIVGAVALEGDGDARLLRSLVVAGNERGAGLGVALLRALEQRARDLGVRELWLLTTTAGKFFDRHGYLRAARQDAPAAIADSAEFRELCPDSAELFTKRL